MTEPSSKSTGEVRFGIALKLGMLLAIFGILASGLTGFYTYQTTRNILVSKATQDLLQSTQILGRHFSVAADEVARDILLFSRLPNTHDAATSGPAARAARQHMAEQFRSMLLEHPEYSQMRLISAEQNGIELVRADRDADSIRIVSDEDLQEKLHYPYVYKALRLAEGEVHYSKIFINREEGAHAGYMQPTLQVATPVVGAKGKPLGVIVINVDLQQIFMQLKADLPDEYRLYLTNQAGDYLIHPDNAKTFGFDYGRRFLAQDTFRSVAAIVDKSAESVAVHSAAGQPAESIGGFVRIPFGDTSSGSFVIVGMTVPLSFVLAETSRLVQESGRVVIGFSLTAILLSILVALFFARPLRRLVVAVQQFSETRELTPVPVHSRDELGVLAGSISEMQKHILHHMGAIEAQNKALQHEISARERAEKYEQFRSETLELLAGKSTIASILGAIVRGVEKLQPEMLCSILLLDNEGKHLSKGIAPSLPDFYNAAIDGVGIGMGVGSCGTAAFTGERVIASDIQTHPYWAAFKDIAAQARLGSCWSQPILSSAGKVLGTFAIYHHHAYTPEQTDIDLIEQTARLTSIAIEHMQSEEALLYSEQRFRDVSEAVGEYLWELDTNMLYTYVSNRVADVKGYAPEELLGKTPVEFMPAEDIPHVHESINRAIAGKKPFKLQHRNISKTGAVLWEEMSGLPYYDDGGELIGLRGAGLNITARMQAEEEIKNLAFFDHLTSLPNRRHLLDRLHHALASSGRSGKSGALLFLDLDNFKSLNDTLGHDMGDLLLKQVAERLLDSVREGDTIARLGGDEFVVLLGELSEHAMEAAAQTESVGEKILAALNHPYLLATHEYSSTPSIGATLFKGEQNSSEELMKQADIAMYQAKKAGRNTLRFFDPQMQEAINSRVALEDALRNALVHNEFQLYYQVQMDALRRPLGAEALIRWIHPEKGMVSPLQFISLAEENGLIIPIGQWVMETGCRQIRAWQQDETTRDLVLAINVSPKQFRQADFVTQVQAVVQRHAIDPSRLKLELTESLLLEDVEDTIATINALHEIGVQFSLDDFGTGYSSLQYLKQLPLDQLKIDQSFVRDIVVDSSDRAIVRTIVAMAHSLDLDVIAEGVETEDQLELLLDMGCTHYQGFLFSKPVPIAQFEALLKQLQASLPKGGFELV